MIVLAIAAAGAIAEPKVVAMIPPEHRLVEGVASDGETIWVSSVIDRQIIASDQADAKPHRDGSLAGRALDSRSDANCI